MKRVYIAIIAGALWGIGASGCSLPLADQAQKTQNTCTTNAECGDHGVCVANDAGKVCAATQSDLGPVILEVRPASDVKGDTVSQVFTDKLTLTGAFPGGAFPQVQLQIQPNINFGGEIIPPANTTGCKADDGSIPVKIELHSVGVYSNLSSIYKADATLGTNPDTGLAAYRFALKVPTGTYDVYLAPAVSPAKDCTLPSLQPLLFSGIQVTGNTEFTTPMPLPPPDTVKGTIAFPPGTDVSMWKVEVVDPDYGLVLSQAGTLGPPSTATGESTIFAANRTDAGIQYSYKSGAYLRVTAPDGKLVVHWSLDPLDMSMLKLSLADLLATTNVVEASVNDKDTLAPVAASVRIRSVMLTGDASANASFRVDTDTDVDGKIHANLVNGTYQVSITPKLSNGSCAAIVDTWEIKGTSAGHSFLLPARPKLTGQVTSPSSAALSQVSVLASPVINSQSYVTSAFDPGDAPPRSASGQTDAFGTFNLLVDPGTVNFSVQPAADTGFSWLLIPKLLIADAGQKADNNVDLQALKMPAPVLVSGTVKSVQGAVPSAVIRAWLPVPVDPATMNLSGSTTLLQIGETISDDTGTFVLPLPPSISFNAPPP